MENLRARKKAPDVVEFQASPGTRLLAAAMCGLLCAMFLFHQTQIEGTKLLVRAFAIAGAGLFGALAWYFWKRGSRKGPVLRLSKQGVGFALGWSGWIDLTWDQVQVFRYWEPTGLAFLVKRRQSRWVGIVLKDRSFIDALPLDQRFEAWLNRLGNRPSLTVLHPFVDAPILDVLQAFKDYAPKELDDYKWLSR
ncbi:MAG: hypothetical protein AAGD13_18665 [Pseudomonadota bacterium]